MLKKVFGRYFQGKNIAIFLIFTVAIMARFVWLDRFPVGMAHDEVEYILSSKSYALYGRDLSGYSFPLSLFRSETAGRISAIPPLLISPFYSLVSISHGTARIPYVLVNILTALVFYFFVKKLFNNKKITLVSLLIILISPWNLYFSRWSTDSTFGLLFFLLGITLFLYEDNFCRFLSLPSFILGFFSYHGAKPLFLPVVFVLAIYTVFIKKDKKSSSFIKKYLLLALMFAFLFFVIEKSLPGIPGSGRFEDLFFLDKEGIEKIVNEERRVVIENPLVGLLSNKLTVVVNTFIQKYLQAFNLETLFIRGDLSATYRFGTHGLFYYIDLLLIPLGFAWMLKYKRRKLKLLIMLLFIAPISTAISKVEISILNRSFLMLPTLLVFSSVGLIYLYDYLIKTKGRYISLSLLFLVIVLSALNFFHFYFFRYPVSQQENVFLSERVLANYLNRAKEGEIQLAVIAPLHRQVFLETIFYLDDKTQEEKLKEIYKDTELKDEYIINNIVFKRKCPRVFSDDTVFIIHRDVNCFENVKYESVIQDQKDAGAIFKIYHDTLCGSYKLTQWRRMHFIGDYDIEGMKNEMFCQRWINI